MLRYFTFSFVSCVRFTLQKPAIVTHHIRIETSLISGLHYSNFLMESFSVFVTNCTKVRRKEVKMRMKEVHFQGHSSTHSFVCCQHVLHQFHIVVCSMISKKIFSQHNKGFPSC